MRLVEYIESSRSKTITVENAGELLSTSHSIAYKSKYRIFRGVNGSGTDFLYIDPSKGEPRVSKNTSNYYTLIIDNSSKWKSYPKRSRSIICSTDLGIADDYGTSYNIYPINDAKIGVCPEPDIWRSFEKTLGNDWMSLEDMNAFIGRILSFNNVNSDSDKSYDAMIKSFKIVDKKRKPMPFENISSHKELLSFYDKFLSSGKTLLDYLDGILSPTKNGFKMAKAGDQMGDNNEIWTSSPCVMVKCMPDADERLSSYMSSI